MGTEERHQIPTGKSLLMVACEQGRSLDVKILLQKKPLLVASRDRGGKTALHYCAEAGSVACAQLILCADVSQIHAQDKDGYTPLHLAVIAGKRHMVKFLLKRGADADGVDKERHSCVHWATVCGDLETLEILLSHGATPSTADMLGAYPIHYAAQMCGPHSLMGNDTRVGVATLRKLIRGGAPIHCRDRDGREPILWAASAGSSEAVLLLFTAGANVSTADKDGLTALHCAASRGHTGCVETLVTLCGAGVNVGDMIGCSPLFYAAAQGHADASQTLLKYGADPNLQDHKGRTPGHCAATKGQLETIRILDSNGADLWIRNSRGNLPLHEAVQCGRKDLVQWLLQQNPPAVNATNISGRTPLHIAAQSNNVEMCEVLIDYGAYINPLMVNPKGFLMTPLDAAVHQGNQRCAKYVQLHGGVLAKKVLENNGINRNLLYSLGNYACRRKDQEDDMASFSSAENRAPRPSTIKIEPTVEVSLSPQVASPPPSPTDSILTNVQSESADASVHIHLSREDLWSLWESFMNSDMQSEECSCSEEVELKRHETEEGTHRAKPALITNVYLTSAHAETSTRVTETTKDYAKDSLLRLPKGAAKTDSSEGPESSQGSCVTRTLSISTSRKEIYVSKKKESLESLPTRSLPSTIELQRQRNSDSLQLDREERSTYSSDISGISVVRRNEIVTDGESSVGSDTGKVLVAKKQKMAKLRKKRSDGRPVGREIDESETSSGVRQTEQRERYIHLRKQHQKSDRSPENRALLLRAKHGVRHGNSENVKTGLGHREKLAQDEKINMQEANLENQEGTVSYIRQSRTTYSQTEQHKHESQLLESQRSGRHKTWDNFAKGRIPVEVEQHFSDQAMVPRYDRQYEDLVNQTAALGDQHLHYHHHHHHHHYHHVHEQESRTVVNSERELSNASISGAQEIDERTQTLKAKRRQSRRRFRLNWKSGWNRSDNHYRTRRHKSDNEFHSRDRYERILEKDGVVRSKSEVCLGRNTRSLVIQETAEPANTAVQREQGIIPEDFINDRQLGDNLQDRLTDPSQNMASPTQESKSSKNFVKNLSDNLSQNIQSPAMHGQESLPLNPVTDNSKNNNDEQQQAEICAKTVYSAGDNLAARDRKKLSAKTTEKVHINRATSVKNSTENPHVGDTVHHAEESIRENNYSRRHNVSPLNKTDDNYILNEELDHNDHPNVDGLRPPTQTSEDEAIGMDEAAQSTDDARENDDFRDLERAPCDSPVGFKADKSTEDDVSGVKPQRLQSELLQDTVKEGETEYDSARNALEEINPILPTGDRTTEHERLSSGTNATENKLKVSSGNILSKKRDGAVQSSHGPDELTQDAIKHQDGEIGRGGERPQLADASLHVTDSLTEDSETISSETSVEGERKKIVTSGRKSRLGRPYSKQNSALLRNSAKSEPIPESGPEDLSIKPKKPATAASLLRLSQNANRPEHNRIPTSPDKISRKFVQPSETEAITVDGKASTSPNRMHRKAVQPGGVERVKKGEKSSSPNRRERKDAHLAMKETTKEDGKRSSPNRADSKVAQAAGAETVKNGKIISADYDGQHLKRSETAKENNLEKQGDAERSDTADHSVLPEISRCRKDSDYLSVGDNSENKEDFETEENILTKRTANENGSNATSQEDLVSTEQHRLQEETSTDAPKQTQLSEAKDDVAGHRHKVRNTIVKGIENADLKDRPHTEDDKKRSTKLKNVKQPNSVNSEASKDSEAKFSKLNKKPQSRISKRNEKLRTSVSKEHRVANVANEEEPASSSPVGSTERKREKDDEIKIIVTSAENPDASAPEGVSVPVKERTVFSSDDTDHVAPQGDVDEAVSKAVKMNHEEDDVIKTGIPSEKSLSRKSAQLQDEKSKVPSSAEQTAEDQREQNQTNFLSEEEYRYYAEHQESSKYIRKSEVCRHETQSSHSRALHSEEELCEKYGTYSELEVHSKTSKTTKQKIFPTVIHRRRASVPRDNFHRSREDIENTAIDQSGKRKSDPAPVEKKKHIYKLLTPEHKQYKRDQDGSRKFDVDDNRSQESPRKVKEEHAVYKNAESSNYFGRSKSADPIAKPDDGKQVDLQAGAPQDEEDFRGKKSEGQPNLEKNADQDSNEKTELISESKYFHKEEIIEDQNAIIQDGIDEENFVNTDDAAQSNSDTLRVTEVSHCKRETHLQELNSQHTGDGQADPQTPRAQSFVVHFDQKRDPKRKIPIQAKTGARNIISHSEATAKESSDTTPPKTSALNAKHYESKKSVYQKIPQTTRTADELTIFCPGAFAADQDRILTPPSIVNSDNKPQKCTRYSYTSLEKPGFLWVHFGSGSSPTKAINGKAKPVKDFKRFRVEKKTTKAQITPKENTKPIVQKRKPVEAKKEKFPRNISRRANLQEPDHKIAAYIKQKEVTFTKSERKKVESFPPKKIFPSRPEPVKLEVTNDKLGSKTKGGASPPKKSYPSRIPAARGVSKRFHEKGEDLLPSRRKDSEEKKKDLSDKPEHKREDDNGQRPPATSESSSLGEGDLRLTVERKTNPEISIKIKVSDTSPKRADKTKVKPSEVKKKNVGDQADLSASLSESGYSSVKDSSGYMSTVESIYNNRRNITIDLGHTKAKIDTAVNFSGPETTDDPTKLQVRGTKIPKDTKIVAEDVGQIKSHTSVHSVIIDVGTNFEAQKIFHHDHLHQIPSTKRGSESKIVSPCPLDEEDESVDSCPASKMVPKCPLDEEDERVTSCPAHKIGSICSLDKEDERVSPNSDATSAESDQPPDDAGMTRDPVPWPAEEDPSDLPTALDKLMDPLETPTKSISGTEPVENLSRRGTETSEEIESIKEERTEKKGSDYEESTSADAQNVSGGDNGQMLPPTFKRKAVPKYPSKIPPPRTYSESNIQSLLMRGDYKPQTQSRSMPSLIERQTGRGYKTSRPIERYRQTGIKEAKVPQVEDAVSRFPAIHPSKSEKFHSRDPVRLPAVSFQAESSFPETTMPRITVDAPRRTRRAKGGVAASPASQRQHLKLPILQQPVRCTCTILPQERLDNRRTKSAVECIANVHFLTEEELARFESRSRTSQRRILRREEVTRPIYHPLRYKALRTQTLKYLRQGQSTRDRQPMITFHVDHDKERNTFKLPTSKLSENKKWQVVFTIGKTDDVEEKERDTSKK